MTFSFLCPHLYHLANDVIVEGLGNLYFTEGAGSNTLGGLEVNSAVYVGRVGIATTVMYLGNGVIAVTKNCEGLSDLLGGELLGYGKLSLHEGVVSILLYLLVDLIVHFGGGSALLG